MLRPLIALLCGLATAASAWELKPQASSLSVAMVGETFRFAPLRGTVDKVGMALLTIPLSGIDTGVPERDEQVRTLFFEVARFPSASFFASVDLSQVNALAVGEQVRLPVSGSLTLRGRSAEVAADTLVALLEDGSLQIRSAQPVMIDIADFDLGRGLSRLQRASDVELERSIPVSFTLVFAP